MIIQEFFRNMKILEEGPLLIKLIFNPEMVWGLKNPRGVWGGIPPSLFPLFEGQLKQNLVACKYVTNSIQNRNKIDDFVTGLL